MAPTLLLIHGMFLTPKSWDPWVRFFEHRGYRCLAPPWPFHEGEPAELRAHPPAGLGELQLDSVVHRFAAAAAAVSAADGERPVLIGHSMGGLVAQILVERGLGRAGVCISSVAPNRMLSLDWSFFKTNAAILNPLAGDHPYVMTPEVFQQSYTDALTDEEALAAFEQYAVPESRNVLRDSMGHWGHVDVTRPHAPLLFVGGDRDHIIPDTLTRRNAEAYTHAGSISDFQDFSGRGHFICHEPGWQTVAAFIESWLTANVEGRAPIGFTLR
jgi:pimeloyl-ACP methyl ester carboxylesterase